MSNKVKDLISIEHFDLNNIEIDKKSHKNIFISSIGYVTIKKDLKNYIVNSLYLNSTNVHGYFEEINGKKIFKASSY